MKIDVVETERLILRPLSLDDTADLFRVRRDPETVRFWDSPAHTSEDETRHMVEQTLGSSGVWWVICLRDDRGRRAIGLIGFHGNPGAPGIGYILRRDQWRRGLRVMDGLLKQAAPGIRCRVWPGENCCIIGLTHFSSLCD